MSAVADDPDSPVLQANRPKRTFVYNRANSVIETVATVSY